MTGVCSPSMPVWVVEDGGRRAYSTLNEGPGRTLWFGVADDEAVERLRFFRDELGPALARLLEHRGPVDVFGLAAQGLNMGDELHMRSQATGNLLLRDLAPAFAALGGEASARFIAGNHHFFLNLTMAAAKCASMAAGGAEGSSVVSLMSRNGTDVGIQVAGLPGRWFTAPAAPVQDTLLREGHDAADAALDIGDSAVIECIGLGGMAIGAAPAVAAFFGGDAAAAAARTELMAEICVARSSRFTVTALDNAGTPVGIDARLVAELEVTPQITTGVLHASSGAGQIGAGRGAPAGRAVRGRRHGARRGAVGRIVAVIEVGPNFIARPYRGVSVQDAEALDEGSLRRWLVGRRVYRRTEFVIATRDGEHAVVQVERPVGRGHARRRCSDLRVLARPGRGRVRRRPVGRHRQRVADGARRPRVRAGRARVRRPAGGSSTSTSSSSRRRCGCACWRSSRPSRRSCWRWRARCWTTTRTCRRSSSTSTRSTCASWPPRIRPSTTCSRAGAPGSMSGRLPRRRAARAGRLDARGLRALAPDPRRAVRRRAGRSGSTSARAWSARPAGRR